ncbi:MAG: secretin N-terminal domain-containing protein [Burkholderiales bacterium]
MKTRIVVAMALTLALGGCVAPPPVSPGVDPAIRSELGKAASERKSAEPKAEAVEQALLPPLRMEMPSARGKPIDPRFDLSVNNAPAHQVFNSIVSGTRYSMLVHPSVTGAISINLKDVTVREALDSIRELFGYDYKIDGTRVIIHSAGMQTRIFKVNYIMGDRRGLSDVRVQSGSVTDATGSGSAPGSVATAGGLLTPPGAQTTTRGLDSSRVTTRTQNDFWADLRSSLMAIVGAGEGRNVVVTPNSGVVLVRALPMELRNVEQYLRATRIAVERQVMLEAKIIDVELAAGFQSGINWAAFPTTGSSIGQARAGTILQERSGPLITGATVQGSPASPSPGTGGFGALPGANLINFALGGGASVFGLALQTASFAALMSFLESQGNTQVLSSPRVATLNNQKAVLKVGTDEFFVTNIQSATTVATAAGVSTGTPIPTVTVQPFFSGIVLDVTPQIDENDQIILHIHPSVSQVTTDNKDINLGAAGSLTLPLAKSNVSETDTIVRVGNGNIVALGGLMKLDTRDSRGGLPGATSSFGGLLGSANKAVVKKEMVILLKPTIIQGDRSWDEGFDEARERFEQLNLPDARGYRQ